MKLTDISVRSLKAPAKGAVIFSDDTLPGFGVRVSQAGTKSFVLTHGIRRTRETIGRVGIISLSDARTEAKRRFAEYTLGKHKPRAVTWDKAKAEFLAAKTEKLKARTVEDYTQLLSYYPFGTTHLADITDAQLQRDVGKIKAKVQRFNSFVVLRTFFRWAYRKHYIDHNPVDRMEAPKAPKSRKRVLSSEELATVLKTALGGETAFHSIVALLVLTGQRRSEIGALEWAWIDLNQKLITIPGEHVKNGEEHCFPIGDMAVQVLRKQKGQAQYIFPAKPGRWLEVTSFNGWSKAKAAFDQECPLPHWTLHDLRRTLRTNWAELGVLEEVAEKYINHISGKHSGLGRTYNRAKYLAPMREAVSGWERHLQTLPEICYKQAA